MRRDIGIFIVFCGLVSPALNAGEGFKPIFNGKDLDGWKAPDMSRWTVEDGAITGTNTAENPIKDNHFLVWEYGQLDDFVLKLKFRILGHAGANAGVQFRSQVRADGHAMGYQADLDRAGQWIGAIHDELGRGTLAQRGQKVELTEQGEKRVLNSADAAALFKRINIDDWNEYQITAVGNTITLAINGVTTAELIDNDEKHRDLAGALAMQLHSGPPMKVQYKDIQLKRLPLNEGRKKVVFVAGGRSHGFGAHDHLAGCSLLAEQLNTSGLPIHATVYYPQWPKDPTAFDNANAIIMYADGGRGHPVVSYLDEIAALAGKGVGIGAIHYGVEVENGKPGDAMLEWTGGYFEAFRSVNPHWTIKNAELVGDHPITRGVKPYEINDEWYYNMRFNRQGQVSAILQAVPPVETITQRWSPRKAAESHAGNPDAYEAVVNQRKPQVLMWARQRDDGGRGFGFTGGHVHWNWGHPEHRKLVLNAAAWIAGLDVPSQGVAGRPVGLDDLLKNHDEPMPEKFDLEKIKQILAGWNN